MAIKSVQAIVNGVTTTLTYDSASKTYKATLTAPAKSSYNQSGHYYGVQIIAKDEAGNTTTVNQSDATLGSKLRLTLLRQHHSYLRAISRQFHSQSQMMILVSIQIQSNCLLMVLKYLESQRQRQRPVIHAVINRPQHFQTVHTPLL